MAIWAYCLNTTKFRLSTCSVFVCHVQDLVQNPKFIEAGISRFDVCQGTLGDCWYLSVHINRIHKYEYVVEYCTDRSQVSIDGRHDGAL